MIYMKSASNIRKSLWKNLSTNKEKQLFFFSFEIGRTSDSEYSPVYSTPMEIYSIYSEGICVQANKNRQKKKKNRGETGPTASSSAGLEGGPCVAI
jgi:hypothetical protein